ncbi:MAG TPA: DUF3800 domain-containing protein [Ignavibacteria bacterium]|nr:DUF3800 domain-containing protein [Ignavibacteria bacterium]
MKYYLFIDETGDHSLSNVDQNFPIFMIGGVLISEKEYKVFQEKINDFKNTFFGTKEIILHSRDIRKINPPFQILFDLKIKERFYKELDDIIEKTDFVVNPVAILKNEHIKKYGKVADNPYTMSLNFIIERTVFDCDELEGCSEVEMVIEKRGKKEDAGLLDVYQKIRTRGTGYVSSERIIRLFSKIDFKNKMDNDEGLQLSDLISYPIARKILYSKNINPAYDILKSKIRKKGWKIFP